MLQRNTEAGAGRGCTKHEEASSASGGIGYRRVCWRGTRDFGAEIQHGAARYDSGIVLVRGCRRTEIESCSVVGHDGGWLAVGGWCWSLPA